VIGDKLKQFRIQAKLTQKEVSDIINVTPQTISKWELNSSEPSLDMLKELCSLYNTTLNELIDGNQDIDREEVQNEKVIKIALYAMYFILFSIAVIINFVDYFIVDVRFVDFGFFQIWNPDIIIVRVGIELKNWFYLTLSLGLPIILFTLNVVEKKHLSQIITTYVGLISLLAFQILAIASPWFVSPDIGFILHMVYDVILIAIIIFLCTLQKWKVKQHFTLYLKTWIGFIGMIVATVIFPFLLKKYYYNFSSLDLLLFIWMILTAGILLFKDAKKIQTFAYVNSIISLLVLSVVAITMFMNGEALSGIAFIVFMTFEIISLSDMKLTNQKSIHLSDFKIVPFEMIIIVIYIYMVTNNGDLFIQMGSSFTAVRMSNLPLNPAFILSGFVFAIGMAFRWLKIKKVYMPLYITWLIFQGLYAVLLLITYPLSRYSITDGILLYVPAIIGVLILSSILEITQRLEN